MNWDDIMMEDNYERLSAYAQSKLAVILFNLELSKRLKGKSGFSLNMLKDKKSLISFTMTIEHT